MGRQFHASATTILKSQRANDNMDTNTGSALRGQEGQEAADELETLTTLRNALREAYGYQATEASQDTLTTLHNAVLHAYGYTPATSKIGGVA